MNRLAETPVQNLTLERKEGFREAKKESLANPMSPCFFGGGIFSPPLLSPVKLTHRWPAGGHRHAVPDLISCRIALSAG